VLPESTGGGGVLPESTEGGVEPGRVAEMPRPERTALPPFPTWAAYLGPTLRLTVDSIFPIVADTESGFLRA
jgi:hypothetical protein